MKLNKTIMITGGAGFIGSHVVKHLMEYENCKIIVVDNLSTGDINNIPVKFKESMICNINLTRINEENKYYFMQCSYDNKSVLNILKDCDYVLHFAATPRVGYSVEYPLKTHQNNVEATLKLLDACKDAKIKRFIFSSSSSVVGNAKTPTTENEQKQPRSPYALQKSIIEDYCRLYSELYGLDSVSLRYFNVYGPGQLPGKSYSTVIPAWFSSIKNNKPLLLEGDGTQSRDFCYIDNVVQANILSILCKENLKGEVLNIGCNNTISLNEILDFLNNKFKNLKIEYAEPRIGDVHKTHALISKAKKMINYNPKIKFFEGLELTLKWWNL